MFQPADEGDGEGYRQAGFQPRVRHKVPRLHQKKKPPLAAAFTQQYGAEGRR